MSAPVTRRSAPTDRRSPTRIARGGCPVGQGCYCCPNVARHNPRAKHGCPHPHPATELLCSPPCPPNLPPCPERSFLPIDPPGPPPGARPLRFVVCDDCGRITARRWTSPDGRVYAWCAGEFPDLLTNTEETR